MELSVKLLFAPLELRATEPVERRKERRKERKKRREQTEKEKDMEQCVEPPTGKSEAAVRVARFGGQVRLQRQCLSAKCSQ